ncbi:MULTISPECIES: outer membrane protein transport protein [Pseudomonas]|uniref:outer membrane protein transport protein n=1 Tax=Pseudomonas TaxID=286 RepID=UPI000D6FBA38|nr:MULTISPECIES: outer membrane protein transport protein [unclassified Pseudomonas]MED5611290.1 outer membrane protein transport protein [Pseudomonas sp. JH-2]PWU30042.1 aromatic hydrocarbon degradation protein [Pseudomonas sp. RW407]
MTKRISPLLLAMAGAGLGWILPAQAQLANDITIGNPKAMALGNAVTADSTGIDAVHYNPAALTKLKGRQTTVKLVSGVMDIRAGFHAPPNYGESTFGVSDDPVANSHSRTMTPTMYLPGLGGMTDVPMLVAPLAGLSINPPGSKFTFATNVYTPQALGYSRDSDSDPGRYDGRRVSLQRLTYFSPSVGYQMNDSLSFGLSIGFSHQAMALDTDFRNPGLLTGLLQTLHDTTCVPGAQEIVELVFNVCGGRIGPYDTLANLKLDMQQTLSPSYNLGVLWEPNDWFAWGAVYQSESRMKLKGKYRVDYTKDWQGFWSGLQNSVFGAFLSPLFPYGNADEEHGVATLKMTNPDNFSTGIKLRPFDDWQFNFDLKWSGYSDWNNLEIEFDKELDLLRIAKNFAPNGATDHSIILDRGYRDTWSYAMGVQYDVNDRLQLRAGYEYRPSAIPKSKADALVPIGDADLYGLGLGYRWDKDTNIDLGFNYFVSKQSIKNGQSCNLTCTGIDNLVYNPYAGMDVHTTVKAYIFALTYNTTF